VAVCASSRTPTVSSINSLGKRARRNDQVLEHLGTASRVRYFGVSGMERLVREVRSALHRRKTRGNQARRSSSNSFAVKCCESLTSMLLSCELPCSVPGVPAPAAEKIRLIDNLARDIRQRLGAA